MKYSSYCPRSGRAQKLNAIYQLYAKRLGRWAMSCFALSQEDLEDALQECSCTVEKQQQKQNKDSRPAAIPSKRDTVSFCNFFVKSIENYNAECYNVLEQ